MEPTVPDASSPMELIRARIQHAARAAGRPPGAVGLTAVSKQQSFEAVERILQAGQRVFGENRVQEAASRWRHKLSEIELRLIGPLQTNKVAEAVRVFDVIETLDRPRLASALARTISEQGKAPRLYIQINTGEEPQKSGILPRDADAFIQQCRHEFGLAIEGLMCVPPLGEPPGAHFAFLAKLARRNGLSDLSMGMSADFEIAIRHGATWIRVGSALFGEREARGAAASQFGGPAAPPV